MLYVHIYDIADTCGLQPVREYCLSKNKAPRTPLQMPCGRAGTYLVKRVPKAHKAVYLCQVYCASDFFVDSVGRKALFEPLFYAAVRIRRTYHKVNQIALCLPI